MLGPPGAEPLLRGASTRTVVLAFTASPNICIFAMRMRWASSSFTGWPGLPGLAGGAGGASGLDGRAISSGADAGPVGMSGTLSGLAGSIKPPVLSPAISLANIDVLPAFSLGPSAGAFCLAARSAATRAMTSTNDSRTPPRMYMGMLLTRRTPAFLDTSPGEASGAI